MNTIIIIIIKKGTTWILAFIYVIKPDIQGVHSAVKRAQRILWHSHILELNSHIDSHMDASKSLANKMGIALTFRSIYMTANRFSF